MIHGVTSKGQFGRAWASDSKNRDAPARASALVGALAGSYRYLLRSGSKRLVSLAMSWRCSTSSWRW